MHVAKTLEEPIKLVRKITDSFFVALHNLWWYRFIIDKHETKGKGPQIHIYILEAQEKRVLILENKNWQGHGRSILLKLSYVCTQMLAGVGLGVMHKTEEEFYATFKDLEQRQVLL